MMRACCVCGWRLMDYERASNGVCMECHEACGMKYRNSLWQRMKDAARRLVG